MAKALESDQFKIDLISSYTDANHTILPTLKCEPRSVRPPTYSTSRTWSARNIEKMTMLSLSQKCVLAETSSFPSRSSMPAIFHSSKFVFISGSFASTVVLLPTCDTPLIQLKIFISSFLQVRRQPYSRLCNSFAFSGNLASTMLLASK